ncbi:pyruvate kinase, partial [Candidatus Bathyarchaeota archaeon]|nr:pyruvate kinase [Candidatus Bathyarchaeota archaeon]
NQYEETIRDVRKVGDIPILLDLKGPEIRIKLVENIELKANDLVEIGSGGPMEFTYNIYDQLNVGDKVLVDDGKISMRIIEVGKSRIQLCVDRGGRVEDGKGINIPGSHLIVPSISNRDLEAISLARECDVEFIALSFVRGKDDILDLKSFAHDLRAEIIAKIENHQGVENFEEILREADGIMVARGDLGVEMDLERIPLIQKQIIERCNQEGKLVITATEMLESMTNNATPTRAEVSDVANAILDGTDTLMLSEETAIGKYPVEAVSMMNKIAEQVEGSTRNKVKEEQFHNISSTISRSIWQIAEEMPLDIVVTMTRTGYTAKMITRFKLRQPIIAVTPDRIVKDQLKLYYGVQPIQFDYEGEKDRILAIGKMLHSKGILREEDNLLFTAGMRTSQPHTSNLIEIHTMKELLELEKRQPSSIS